MKLNLACLRFLGLCGLAMGLMAPSWAQTEGPVEPLSPVSAPLTLSAPVAGVPLAATTPTPTLEQAWDVVEVMGRPLEPSTRRARLVVRSGTLLVDGGCNYFSGRLERGAEGLFRVSRYSGTHSACPTPSRGEAVLNSALVMVNNYRLEDGLVLRSGDSAVVRLAPSASQDSSDIEQAVARARPAPRAESRSARSARAAAAAPAKKTKASKAASRNGAKASPSSRAKPAKAKVASSTQASRASPPAKGTGTTQKR
jgi:heat shock protein HslJ